MSLASEVQSGRPVVAQPVTRIDAWLADATPDDAAALVAVLQDPKWRHTDIAALLGRHGCVVSDVAVGKYRRRHYGSR